MNILPSNHLRFIAIIICILIIIPANQASAISQLTKIDLQEYAANSIYFINPCVENGLSSSGGQISSEAVASGSNAKEKIWSALKSLNIEDHIAAGIMGNIANEGSVSPARYEQQHSAYWQNGFNTGFDWEFNPAQGYGVGLVQWSGGRRVKLFAFLRERRNDLVEKYIVHPETYGAMHGDEFIQTAGEADSNALYALEVEYIVWELQNVSDYAPVLASKNVHDAAENVSVYFEACDTCKVGTANTENRIRSAEEYYREFTGKTSFGSGSSASSGSDKCCPTTSSSNTNSNITWDTDGWIQGGINEYIKDPAIGTPYLKEGEGDHEFATETPNGNGNGPNKITLHSTEGSNGGGGSPLSFFGGYPPHFTIDVKEKRVFQHFSINKTSAAVASHDDTAGVQIEIIGYSDAALARSLGNDKWILSSYSDSELQYLVQLLQGISEATGIPLTSSADWSGDASGTPRLSANEFANYQGIIGHRQVPDNNHWDPHALWDNLKKVLESSGSSTSNQSANNSLSSSVTSGSSTTTITVQNEGENVTIIGDSITNGTKQAGAFDSKLKNADIIAQDSKNMFGKKASNKTGETIIDELINNKKLRDIVVIALGTNDGTVSQNDVEEKIIKPIDESGNHTIVFVTTYGYGRSDGQDYSDNNKVFTTIKNTHPNVLIADWASAASKDPSKYIANDGLGVHPTNPDGTNLFASTIYDAISNNSVTTTVNCPGDGNNSTNGDVASLQKTVKEFAWPEYHPKPYVNRKQEYVDAINQGGYIGDGCHGGGVDCGAFVYQVITKSGWDPNYGGGSGQTNEVQGWMRGDGASTWENVTSKIKSNNDAKPGDVILRSDHVLLFVGEISGFGNVMASASRCGRAPMADGASDIYANYIADGYEVWRKK